MSAEREFLTPDQAIAMLPDGEFIHTFRQAGWAIIGTDWERKEILEAIQKFRPELSGDSATSMGHGIVLEDELGFLFIETKTQEAQP